MLHDLIFRLSALFQRRRMNAELDEELADHIEHETEKRIHTGMDPVEARRQALIAFGGIEQARQQTRESRGLRLLEQLMQDIRYGIRALARDRGFTIVVILTLALGIGACSAIFSLMNAVLFPPLPYANADRLVYITTPNHHLTGIPEDAILPDNADFADMRRNNHSLSSMTQFLLQTFKVDGTGVSLGGARVDGSFFATLGVPVAMGRAINAADNEPGNDHVAVISYSLWQRMFASAPSVLGQKLHIHHVAYTVVGVMPQGFSYPSKTEVDYGDASLTATDVWLPLALTAKDRADRGLSSNNYALGLLKPGISVQQATDNLNAILRPLNPLHTGFTFREGWYAYVKPFRDTVDGSSRPLMLLLLGSVTFVLLIACANVANLLLARGANRTHELGVRVALGAGRTRIARQLLTESLLLGLSGGIAGLGLAWVFLRLLLKLDPGNIPRLQQSSLNPRVLFFTAGIAILAGVLAGLAPALLSSRVRLLTFLRGSAGTRSTSGRAPLRGLLVIGEISIVVVLLAGAGLLLRSYANLESVPTGFSSTTLSMKVQLRDQLHTPQQREACIDTLITQLHGLTGVQQVGVIDSLPFGDNQGAQTFWLQGFPNRKGQMVNASSASSGYFSTMGIPLLEGRLFSNDYSPNDAKELIINQAFAQTYFAGRNPIGKWLSYIQPDDPHQTPQNPMTIVGVVANTRGWDVTKPPEPQIFHPAYDLDNFYLVVRSLLPTRDVVDHTNAILHGFNAYLSVSKVHTMRELVSESTARQRFQMVLLTVFAVMALVLALVGFYGLLAYAARQRSPEVAVRIALGADRAHILRLILHQGLRLVLTGLTLGCVAALALTRLLTSWLFHVSPLDPLTFALVPALLLLAAIAACLLPAWRAANTDPIRTLRCE